MINLPRKSRLSAEREAEIAAAIAAGHHLNAVARLCKADCRTVRAVALRLGLTLAPAPVVARLDPADIARREALALELLRGGVPRQEVSVRARIPTGRIKQLAESNGIAKLKTGTSNHTGRSITSMSHAELDALEADVAAKRAQGLLPQIAAGAE